MEENAYAIWVGDEDRDAVGKRHGHGGAIRAAQVAIRPRRVAKPTAPTIAVPENATSVYLHRGRKSSRLRTQRLCKAHPAAKNCRCGFIRGEVVAACLTRRGERNEAKLAETRDLFVWGEDHCDWGKRVDGQTNEQPGRPIHDGPDCPFCPFARLPA